MNFSHLFAIVRPIARNTVVFFGAFVALSQAGCASSVLIWHGHSPDRTRRALLLEEGGRQRLVVDGEAYPSWEAVGFTHLCWGPRGPIYPALEAGRWHVVEGRLKGPAFSAIGELVTAGGRIAYAAQDAEGWRVVLDGRPGPPFASLRAGSLRFSEEGRRLVYVAEEGEGERAVIEGRPGPLFGRILALGFGDQGRRVGYVGRAEDGAQIVIDGAPVATSREVRELALAPQTRAWAALVVEGEAGEPGSALLLRERGEGPERLPVQAEEEGLSLSGDGSRLAWTRPGERAVEVLLDGAPVGAHLEVASLRFVGPSTDRDGVGRPQATLLYVAREEGGARVIFGGEAGPLFGSIEELAVSPAGHWGYVGSDAEGRAVLIDGLERFRGDWAGGLRLAARSGRWAFLVREGERRFVQRPGGRWAVQRPIVDTFLLDPEGERWGLVVADPARRALEVTIDGRAVAPLDLDEVSAALAQGGSPGEAMRAIVEGELLRAARAAGPEAER